MKHGARRVVALVRPAMLCMSVAVAFAAAGTQDAIAQIKSFPQAEGFGAEAVGGRGGIVYHVTTLSDTNVPGTLRYGLNSLPGNTPVTIVFDVGGWINLNSNLGVTRNNVTIAGHTAPGGIGLKNRKFSIGGDDIIVRHMHFAYGVTAAAANDTINVNENSSDVIFDHISAGLSRDETFSVQSSRLTLQWSNISYGLLNHSAGSLIEQAHQLTFHHNVYAHNHTRNPKARVNDTIDWINNVVYDYNNGFIAGDSDTTDYFWTANFDGNYYITGRNEINNRMISSGRAHNYGLYFGTNGYDGDGDTEHDGIILTRSSRELPNYISGTYTWSDTPFPVDDPVWKDDNPEAAYERVLAEFGATPWARNDFDALVASNVANREGFRISNQSQLPIGNGGFGTITGGVAPADSDGDGMPDWWEAKHGLDPARPDNNGDFTGDGYTNLEHYLNEIAAFKATGPLEFAGGSGRYAQWQNWTRRWTPSRFDDVHVNSGTATVDTIGQHAGVLKIGTSPGDSAELRITDGWLRVAEELVIGADDAATAGLILSGGKLVAPRISKGADGAFAFTGGVLHADVVEFDLANNGGTIAPGDSLGPTHLNVAAPQIGQMHVLGDLTLNGGAVEIELASAAAFDKIIVDGLAKLDGNLSVALLDGFAPQSGSWEILQADSIMGSFASVTNGFSLQQQGSSLFLVVGSGPLLPGDYNGDGTIDAADYSVWRDTMGQMVPNGNGADGDGDGSIGHGDYVVWRNAFMAGSGGSGSLTTPVPEPSAACLVLIALAPLAWRRHRPSMVIRSVSNLR